MATPALPEQSISTFLSAEVMVDADNGQPALVASTEVNLGDLREISPTRLLGLVADTRAKLDQIERLAREYEARDTLRAIVAEHELVLEELDTDTLFPEHLRGKLKAWYGEIDGARIVAVPVGQDPVERANVVAALVNDLQAQA
ncbi:hypothetical protein [Streptomyces mirabilis]|uniref:hypothetical protein n=1 Tax=Streptomyces mirabilis TaxID=68239 RepID=UPI0036B37ECF